MIIFKITDDLLHEVNEDLSRQHEYSSERIGFLSVEYTKAEENILLLAKRYYPIPDDQYVDDAYSGARINSQAIRDAMQLTLETGDGIFHAHPHYFGKSTPAFGRMDIKEIPRIVARIY